MPSTAKYSLLDSHLMHNGRDYHVMIELEKIMFGDSIRMHHVVTISRQVERRAGERFYVEEEFHGYQKDRIRDAGIKLVDYFIGNYERKLERELL